MTSIVLFVEEPSMKALLDGLIPRLVPDASFQVIQHEGKADLERSLPRKFRAWNSSSPVLFVVLRDRDGADCKALKRRLERLCKNEHGRQPLIRIVCNELESWLLGDLSAMEDAYGVRGLAARQRQKKYRDPDRLTNAAQELQELVPAYTKVKGARLAGTRLSVSGNTSKSYQVFLSGLTRRLADIRPTESNQGGL